MQTTLYKFRSTWKNRINPKINTSQNLQFSINSIKLHEFKKKLMKLKKKTLKSQEKLRKFKHCWSQRLNIPQIQNKPPAI